MNKPSASFDFWSNLAPDLFTVYTMVVYLGDFALNFSFVTLIKIYIYIHINIELIVFK